MATIKTYKMIQSCANCKRELIRVDAGTTKIGSPLITCPHCGTVNPTKLRVEWYAYPTKWLSLSWPIILGGGLLITGFFMGEPAVGAFAAIIGALVGLCISLSTIVRMIASMRRMRNPDYLEKLLAHGVLSEAQFMRFYDAAKGK